MARRPTMYSRRARSWPATCWARATSPASAWRSAPRMAASRARRPPAVSGRDAPRLAELVQEAQRVLAICNACRYCEGYCAVFPALERRLSFDEGDVHYLANLCHNCGACLYACQYAPPHEFQLNFPRILAQVRARTYRQYAWPNAFGRAFEANGVVVSIALAMSLMAFFMFVTA